MLLMEALAARGQRGRGAAGVRAAADAAARRARHRALAGGDRGARAAAEPRLARSLAARAVLRFAPARRSSCPPSWKLALEVAARRPRARSWRSCRGCGTARATTLCASGRGRGDLLAGDAGIGKTRLAAELARRARSDGGRWCSPAARPRRRSLPTSRSSRRSAITWPASALDELRRSRSRLRVPSWRGWSPSCAVASPELPPPVGEPETERYRLFEAVVGLLEAISSRAPILLVLDDLHWADRPTLLLLRHLARAPGPAHLLILGRLPDRGDRPGAWRRARGSAPRAAADADRRRGTERARDGRARPDAHRGEAPSPVFAERCTRRPRATRSSSRRSCATSPRWACTRPCSRCHRAAAGRAARGGQAT